MKRLREALAAAQTWVARGGEVPRTTIIMCDNGEEYLILRVWQDYVVMTTSTGKESIYVKD